jgi:hypothetical protein
MTRARPGDEVELVSPPVAFADPWLTPVATRPTTLPTEDPAKRRSAEARVADSVAVRDAFLATLGKPLPDRVAIWEQLLNASPQNAYAKDIMKEIGTLTNEEQTETQIAAGTSQAARTGNRLRALDPTVVTSEDFAFIEPSRVYEGEPFEVSLVDLGTDPILGAWLQLRVAGEAAFQRIDLTLGEDGTLRATVPGALVHAPGVEYFVQVKTGDKPKDVAGSDASPLTVDVDKSVEESPPDRKGRSRVTLFFDYVDFDNAQPYDRYAHAEVDFMYRFRHPIYAFRLGFGTLRGTGGPKDVINLGNGCMDVTGQYRCRETGFSYAYIELEMRVSEVLAFMIRPLGGAAFRNDDPNQADAGRQSFIAAGVRGRIRIGKETETNLAVGFTFASGLGSLVDTAFTWNVARNVPVVLTAQVTNLPALEDFGVRLIADVGWRKLSWVYPSVRISYQARDENHSGVSGGLAVNFDW